MVAIWGERYIYSATAVVIDTGAILQSTRGCKCKYGADRAMRNVCAIIVHGTVGVMCLMTQSSSGIAHAEYHPHISLRWF